MCIGELIEKFNNGDINSLGQIYDNVANEIFNYAYGETNSSFISDELVEKTMIDISKNAYMHEGKNSKEWIMKIAKNCLNIIKEENSNIDINIAEQEKAYLLYNSNGFVAAEKKDSILAKCDLPDTKKYIEYHKQKKLKKRVIISVSMMVTIILLLVLPKYIMMIKDYMVAVKYFDKYGLVKDDLSMDEIIELYEVLYNDDLSSDKAIEIIDKSINEASLSGEMIILPENASIEDKFEILKENEYSSEEIRYAYKNNDIFMHETKTVKETTTIENYVNNELQWTREIEMYCYGYKKWGEDVIFYFTYYPDDIYEPEEVYIMLLDENGNTVWEIRHCEEYSKISIIDILICNDNMVVCSKDNDVHENIISEYDKNGKLIQSNTSIMSFSYDQIIGWHKDKEYAIIKEYENDEIQIIDNYGNVKEEKTLIIENIESLGNIDHLIEFKGEIYISSHINEFNLSNYKDYRGNNFSEEEDPKKRKATTRLYRGDIEAYLWKYNNETKKFEKLYSVKAAKGEELEIIGNNLVWSVIGIENFVNMETNSALFYGDSRVYRYIFNEKMEIKEKIRTETLQRFSENQKES